MFDFVFINDRLVSKRAAKISIFNSGFLYGDGIFETLRSYNGKIFALDRHLGRLFLTANALRLRLGFDEGYIEDAIAKTLKKNQLNNSDAYIKVIISRGEYKKRLDIYSAAKPCLIVIVSRLKDFAQDKKGVALISSSIKRDPFINELYRHKSLNYFENIYAKNQALRLGAYDAIFLTKDRYVLECSTSNIFCVTKRKIMTPPLNQNILPGITRGLIKDICRKERIRLAERKLHYSDLIQAEEVFITNSIIEMLPVSRIDIHDIGKQIPGTMTSFLGGKYRDLVDGKDSLD